MVGLSVELSVQSLVVNWAEKMVYPTAVLMAQMWAVKTVNYLVVMTVSQKAAKMGIH